MIGPIAGTLASNISVVREYFTSVLYPFAVTDNMSIANVSFSAAGNLWAIPVDNATITNPTILSGSLIDSIVYQTYTETEPLYMSNAVILSGSLIESIVYQTYTETEPLYMSNAVILSGSLNTTISYITYTETEDTTIANPTILSGTLV